MVVRQKVKGKNPTQRLKCGQRIEYLYFEDTLVFNENNCSYITIVLSINVLTLSRDIVKYSHLVYKKTKPNRP